MNAVNEKNGTNGTNGTNGINKPKTNGQIMFAFTRSAIASTLRNEKPTLYAMLKSMLDHVLQQPLLQDRIVKDSIEEKSLSILIVLGYIKSEFQKFTPLFFGDMFNEGLQKGEQYLHYVPVRE